VAPVTTRIRHIASEVLLGPAEGLPRDCAVTLDTIETFPKSLLDERITALGSEMAEAVDEAIRFALDLGPAG
jgi:mRNA interferase MazF